MKQLEIEVKFFIDNVAELRRKIIRLGAAPRKRVFETNICFEDAYKNLRKRASLLRLRRAGTKSTLTFKSRPRTPDKTFKALYELEVAVDNFDAMEGILTALGYNKDRVYEKWRETFIINSTHLCIDTLPYGIFLEIEGRKEAIKKLARQTGMEWDRRILTNYLAMFDAIRQKEKLAFMDITFENFKGMRVDTAAYLPLFETAGKGHTTLCSNS